MPEIRVIIPPNMEVALNSLIRAGIAGNKAEIVRNAISQYLLKVPTILSKDYDLESVFSPDGRILQVEYASVASNRGLLSVGIQCKDGLVIIKKKPLTFQPHFHMIKHTEYFRPLKKLTKKIEIAMAGISTDGNLVMKKAKEILVNPKKLSAIDIYDLVEELSFFLHDYTIKKGLRVLGAKMIIGGLDNENRPRLFLLEPSGTIHETRVVGIGSGYENVIDEILGEFDEDCSIKKAMSLAIKAVLKNTENVDSIFVDVVNLKDLSFRELSRKEKLRLRELP